MMTDTSSDFPQDRETYEAVVATATAAVDPIEIDEKSGTALVQVVPVGYRVEVTDLAALTLAQDRAQRQHKAAVEGRPERKAGSYQVDTVESFLALWDKHTTAHSEIWVSPTQIKAVLNAASEDDPSFEDLTITLPLVYSPEWLAWTGISGKYLEQAVFAEFLEAHSVDIRKPSAAEAREVAQSLQAKTGVEFKSSSRTQDGQRAFRYEETTTAKAGQKGELEIPATFGLALRVFAAAQDAIEVDARFQFRIRQDSLFLGISIDQVDRLRDGAIELLVKQIADHTKTGALVLRGTGRR